MSPHETDRRHLERQIVYARPIIVLLSILALLQQPHPEEAKGTISFVIAYLIVSLAVIPVERFLRKRAWHLPIACDLLALGIFMYISAICFSIGSILFFHLFFRSRYIPKTLSAFGVIASVIVTIICSGSLIFPEHGATLQYGWAPMAISEVTLGFWLLIKRIRPPIVG